MSLKKESPSDVQLHLASLKGDLLVLKRVLDSGKVHVDCRDRDGTTPLILAAANGHVECVKELLEQGADPRARRVTGTTALFFAAQGGFLDIVQLLLDRGSPVDSASVDGGTPLFVACQCGHMDVVKELVKRGAKVNMHMKDRATPLFIAAQNGHMKILLYLLAQGAEADPRRTDGATPLWIAAQMGHDHIVRQLLKVGANVDAARHDGATALFKAAHKGHVEVIEELLKRKPSLGILPDVPPPLVSKVEVLLAHTFISYFGTPSTVTRMYVYTGQCNVDAITMVKQSTENGESALHAAALFGHLPIVKQLVVARANPALTNQEGMTAFQLAHEAKHYHVTEYLKNAITEKLNGAAPTSKMNGAVKMMNGAEKYQ